MNEHLPPGEFFPLWRVAKILGRDRMHIVHLIEDGDIDVGIDMRRRAATKSCISVPRAALIKFLERRKLNGHVKAEAAHVAGHKNGRAK